MTAMPVTLRPYQATAIENVKRVLRSGSRRVLICAPTGSGKTLTAGAIILGALAKGKRVLFVAHRKELVDQSVEALVRLGVTTVGVIRASDKRRDSTQPVQVASIQTLARRTKMSPPPDIVIIDECHRAVSRSYTEHLYEAYPNAIFLGLTATPCRADGKPLAGSFDQIVPVATYSELIAGGFISEPHVFSTPLLPDLSTVRTSSGEYNQEDLEAAVNRGALIGNIGSEWLKRASTLRTVVFAVSVAHSLAIVDMFKGLGVPAEHLDGTTPETERAAILRRLETGATQVVSNCNVLSEGWDQPSVKCIILARPTKSLALYMQSGGRGLRPFGDLIPIILDHGGNVDRHGMPHRDREWSLTAKPKSLGVAPSKNCPSCFGYIPASERTCPLCGVVQPTPVAPERDPALDVPVDLALRSLCPIDDIQGDAEKLAKFRAIYKQARARGWMPGAVRHRYRELLGEEPAASWLKALKQDYRDDETWKASVAQRKRERAAREAGEEAA
jgi:DNA repair protein RadD